ncbi:MAG: tetratricopeptide repeat protein, partial [Acidiferrobacterales bacterium]
MNIRIKGIIMALSLAVTSSVAMADGKTFDDGAVAFIKGDGQTAFKIWKPLAEKGNTEAQYHLGYLFQTGTGVPADKSKALYWYQMAAK